MRSRPRRRRKSWATIVGSWASSSSALARFAAGLLSSSAGFSAPSQLTAVRSTSMGWQVSGSFSMSPMVDRVSSRWDRSRAVNSCSCAASGSSPFQIR